MTNLLLLAAIFSEVIGAVATRFSNGFSRPVPTLITVAGVLGAYYLLSLVVARGMPLGVAYGIWAALGVTAVAVIGAVLFGDRLTPTQFMGILLVVVGILALQLGAKSG